MAGLKRCVAWLVIVLLPLAAAFPVDDIVIYENSNDLKKAVTENNIFVLFCKPWVVNCKRVAPLWEELRPLYHGNHSIAKLAQVFCSNETTVCTDQNVKKVPVFRFFYKNSDDFSDFIGRRTFESLHRFVEDELHNAAEIAEAALPDAVVELGARRFRNFVSEQLHFVHFYTPWCGHCKKLHPAWHHLALSVAGGSHLFISQVDCAKNSNLCASYDIKGYPSLVVFHNGSKLETYRGSRDLSDLTTFILSKVDQLVQEHVPEVHVENGVVQLTEDNFSHVIKNNLVFVNFFTTWCAQCKDVNAAWEHLAQTNSDRGIMMAALDCEQHSYLCDTRSISVFPTLTLYQGGILIYDYQGNHSLPELQRLIDVFTAVQHDEL